MYYARACSYFLELFGMTLLCVVFNQRNFFFLIFFLVIIEEVTKAYGRSTFSSNWYFCVLGHAQQTFMNFG